MRKIEKPEEHDLACVKNTSGWELQISEVNDLLNDQASVCNAGVSGRH